MRCSAPAAVLTWVRFSPKQPRKYSRQKPALWRAKGAFGSAGSGTTGPRRERRYFWGLPTETRLAPRVPTGVFAQFDPVCEYGRILQPNQNPFDHLRLLLALDGIDFLISRDQARAILGLDHGAAAGFGARR